MALGRTLDGSCMALGRTLDGSCMALERTLDGSRMVFKSRAWGGPRNKSSCSQIISYFESTPKTSASVTLNHKAKVLN